MTTTTAQQRLQQHVREAGEAALAKNQFVTAIDIFIGVGWLTQDGVEKWQKGRVGYLERVMTANLNKLSKVMKIFRDWAVRSGLNPRETVYKTHTRDHRPLRFSKSGHPAIERAYSTHWVSPRLRKLKQQVAAAKHDALDPDAQPGSEKAPTAMVSGAEGATARGRVHPPLIKHGKLALRSILESRGTIPSYHLVHEDGSENERLFTIEVRAGEEALGRGIGPNKRTAEQLAAVDALRALNVDA